MPRTTDVVFASVGWQNADAEPSRQTDPRDQKTVPAGTVFAYRGFLIQTAGANPTG
jgi:hypothetical protein